MIKKLKNFLTLFKYCKKVKQNIPLAIEDHEKIIRSIFSPINLKNLQSLRPNAFRPPSDSDEISVNRLNYTTPDFCKAISIKMERPESDKNYFGFALLYANEIRDSNSDVIYSPQKENIYHADIKIGFVVKKGEQLPAEIQKKVYDLTKKARLFKDYKPHSIIWEGDKIE